MGRNGVAMRKKAWLEKRQITITGNLLLSGYYTLGAALNASCSLSHLGLHPPQKVW